MTIPITIVDAFADGAFSGNPAAVCVLKEPAADEAWMQNVAREMNLSETAFAAPTGEDDAYILRWFTPKVEVALCGHATLATAHVLWSQGLSTSGEIKFRTLSGELAASRRGVEIALDFPALEYFAYAPTMELAIALGVWPVASGRSSTDVLFELKTEDEVRNCSPDFANLAQVRDVRGVIVTAQASNPASSGYDFISRFFAPAIGVDEDPVTGSAHCLLGPYWSARLGKNDLRGYQASQRGGFLGVEVREERVHLIGSAVTVLRGVLSEAAMPTIDA